MYEGVEEEKMTCVTHILAKEHNRIRQMLDLFDAELAVFEAADIPDYEILEGSIAYCRTYLDVHHHPKEDLLLEYLQSRDPVAADDAASLPGQHQILARMTGDVAAIFDAVRDGAEVRRDALVARGQELSAAYRAHLLWEETKFFPVVEGAFSPKDWTAVQGRLEDFSVQRACKDLERNFHVLFSTRQEPERLCG